MRPLEELFLHITTKTLLALQFVYSLVLIYVKTEVSKKTIENYLCFFKGEHGWKTIFNIKFRTPFFFFYFNLTLKKTITKLRLVLLAPTLPCRWISVQTYFALHVSLRSDLLIPAGSQIRPTSYP